MKVLVVYNYPRSLVNLRLQLMAAMRDAGHEVHAAAPGLSGDRPTVDGLNGIGVVMHDVALDRTSTNPVHDIRTFVDLRRLMRGLKPDLVFCYTIKPVIFGTLAAWTAGVPRRVAMMTGLGYAFTGEATGQRRVVQRVVKRLYRPALRRCTLLFFQNPDDRDVITGLGLVGPNTEVAMVDGSGVDCERFAPAPLPEGPTQFLLIARLLGDKGIREYVKAARAVKQTHPEVTFHLVGGVDPNPNGISEAEVRGWAEGGAVVWHGELEDVRPSIAACHVYVLPSYREGTPRTVLEAMAMGRAVITTDAPGCRETVRDGDNGLLVAPRSAEALEAAMRRLVDDRAAIARMGARARAIATSVYDVHRVNAAMLTAMGLSRG